ncbi:MAG: tetratricopeptide repeat protein [Pyrinomonadaceae bacterium]
MKRCPKCGREYDLSMSFCLDDGSELLYGPGSGSPPAREGMAAASVDEVVGDEPQTAILHSTDARSEAATRAQIHTTAAEPQSRLEEGAEKPSFSAHRAAEPPRGIDKRLLLAPVALAVIALGGYFGYRYFMPSKQIESIAVMPFANESGDPGIEYLSDGMTETLISGLSNIPNLSVKGRSIVFFYKGKETTPKKIGEDLGVQAVLLGRVAQRGDDLKLSLELVDAKTGDVIWSELYDRKRADLVRLQNEIAEDVLNKLKVKLSRNDQQKLAKVETNDSEAYELYLKGRYFWNKRTDEDTIKAIEQFKAAADIDPNFALAYAGLADCYVLGMGTELSTEDRLKTGKAFAEKALALDDQLAEPYAALGAIHEQMWLWSEVEDKYKRAIELNPNYATAYQWYSIYLIDFGRVDEAASMIERAQVLDPLSAAINIQVSIIYWAQKNFDLSVRNARRSIELNPDSPTPYRTLGDALLQQGRTDEAVENLEKAVELGKRRGRELGNLGYAYAVQGNRAKALAIANELEDGHPEKGSSELLIASVYAGLGDKDKAFEWLEKCFQNRSPRLVEIRWHFQFASLRDDPRFADLTKRMGLPD